MPRLTDDLVEAELFGHARGAFTGAIADRAGLFEHADGGTLFLDEVIELSPRAQAKLLRALQEGEIRRVGETRSRRVDVRIIAACNRSLQGGVAADSFRADLRFRLDVLRIELPALRARSEDIVELARHFWSRAAARVGSRAQLGPDVLAAFARYDWPGNVRELQNAVAALAASAPARGIVRASALPAQIRSGGTRQHFDARGGAPPVRSRIRPRGDCASGRFKGQGGRRPWRDASGPRPSCSGGWDSTSERQERERQAQASTKKSRRDVIAALRQPKVAVMLMLGFSSGLPFLLTGNTLGYWLRDEGTTLQAIGFLSWVGPGVFGQVPLGARHRSCGRADLRQVRSPPRLDDRQPAVSSRRGCWRCRPSD